MKTVYIKAWFRFEIPDDVPLEDVVLTNAHRVRAALLPPVDSEADLRILADGCRNYETFAVDETEPDEP